MRTNRTKEKLNSGETVFGCFLRYPSAALVEVMGYQDWDFIVFDGEHGMVDPRDCENMVRAAELQDVTPIVRVTTNSPPVILRYMDTGAQGLHVPWVNSRPEAEQAVQFVKYEPLGIRGLASVRAADYGQAIPFGEYVTQANAETLTVIHIETAEAVKQLPEILKVEGLDVIFIGPTDLSHSLGVPGQADHPTVKTAMEQITEAVSKTSVALGIMVPNAQAAQEWRQRGASYITVAFESMLNPGVRQFFSSVRQ